MWQNAVPYSYFHSENYFKSLGRKKRRKKRKKPCGALPKIDCNGKEVSEPENGLQFPGFTMECGTLRPVER